MGYNQNAINKMMRHLPFSSPTFKLAYNPHGKTVNYYHLH